MSDTMNERTAPAPFNPPNGDVILRSSDQVNFYVFKAVLSLSSQFFRDLFSVPQPHIADQAIPVIDIEEDALLLNSMLRFLYPCPDPVITQLEHVEQMLDIARKYDIAIILHMMEAAYLRTGKIDIKPVNAYFLAVRYKWRVAAQAAAKAALKYSVEELLAEEVETEGATIDRYRELLNHHTRVRTACRDVCASGVDIAAIPGTNHSCPQEYFGTKTSKYVPVWYRNYMNRVGRDFMLRPAVALENLATFDETFDDLTRNRGCYACTDVTRSAADMIRFARSFRARMKSVIANIPLNISF